MRIAILLNGPPTAGKGVQGKEIEKYLPCNKIMTSQALEEDGYADKMRKGEMVEDHLVFESVTKRVQPEGHYIFDGFARTLEQATIFPKELRKIGFDLVVLVELNLTNEEKALERRLERKKKGDSNDRPDGDRKETFLNRFHRHNREADKVRTVLIHSCHHVHIIDARKDIAEVSRLIKGYLTVIAPGEINPSQIQGDFLSDDNQVEDKSSACVH